MKTVFLYFIIILVSTCSLAANEQLLHYVTDEVEGGSYKYYSLMYDGIIRIALISQKGDSDLYVSQTTNKPTYDPDNYCLQSTTCGEDIILIPQNFKRPVTIGVYGHPSHESSSFNLFVYHVILSDNEVLNEQSSINIFEKTTAKKINKKSFVFAFLWTFLDQFVQVLFQ